MRSILLPVAIVAALAAPSLALAAAQTTDGTIRSIDTKAMTITLNDGQVFHLPATYKLADTVKAGAKVKVTWDKLGSLNEASNVAIAN